MRRRREPADCGQGEAVILLLAATVGFAAVGGWTLKMLWAIAHNPAAIDWLRSVG